MPVGLKSLRLPLRTSVRELEDAYCAAGWSVLTRFERGSHWLDELFGLHVLSSIETYAQALAFVDQLNRDREQFDPGHSCKRSSGILLWLGVSFWSETPDRIRTAIAKNRHTCCSCHELGSFKVLEDRRATG